MYRRLVFIFLILALLSLACNFSIGGNTDDPTSTPQAQAEPTEVAGAATAEPTEEVVEAPTQAPVAESGAVATLDAVKSATIQIVAQGTFIDPEWGMLYNAAGSGSGFIIDPSGIAITNNHVVTGAALLQVYVGGETRPRNAKVLGVSECSDLAVIDLDGDGYPYLEWYDGSVDVGLDVYAAGFPLGDPEFTLTRGIVSKAETSGETNWASVDNVLEHDATINPGNSGGPLVNENGKVVGVNYAGNSGTSQYFAIAQDEANNVISQLREGKDVNSLGLNGQAVWTEDGSITGIWVSSVKSGSPADKAGIKAGDIVTQLENIILATDGTMADYCDILRSHNPSDTLALSVLRWADQTFLEGQINGRNLEVSFSFAQELGGDLGSEVSSSGELYGEYMVVTDDTGALQVEIPTAWAQVDGSIWETTWGDINITAPSVVAAADVNRYYNYWDESGISFAASSDLGRTGGYVQLLDGVRGWYESDCTYDSAADYEDELYEGRYQLWSNCGGTGSWAMVLSARPKDDVTAFLILLQLTITTDADLEALDHILNTFVVVNGV